MNDMNSRAPVAYSTKAINGPQNTSIFTKNLASKQAEMSNKAHKRSSMENVAEKEVVVGRPSHKKNNSSIPSQYVSKHFPASMQHKKPLNVQVNPKSSRLEIEVGDEGAISTENSKTSRGQKSVSVYTKSSKTKLAQNKETDLLC